MVQLGQPPNRIDLINQISDGKFPEIWMKKVAGTYGTEPVHYIHLDDLLKNKKATARPKDQQDVDFFTKKWDN